MNEAVSPLSIVPISLRGLNAPESPPDGGAAPQLRWIEIEALYVYTSYQRTITKTGRANIERIAREFDWTFFAPVIVSPREGGDFFVIIDGQHRTTAARLIGKTAVPCMVVIATPKRQAAAFRAVNGNVTRMCPGAMLRAAARAGDVKALELEAIAREGGARILYSPTMVKNMKPTDTQAIGTLKGCLARHGRETLVRALLSVTGAPRPYRGMLNDAILPALCLALEPYAAMTREALLRRMAAVNLGAVEQAAKEAQARRGGLFRLHLTEALAARLGGRHE